MVIFFWAPIAVSRYQIELGYVPTFNQVFSQLLKYIPWIDIQKNQTNLTNNSLTGALKEVETNAQYKVVQEQIQQLTTEINDLKNGRQIYHKNNTQINYQSKTQNIPSPPTVSSPRKYQILQCTHTAQASKSLQVAFAEKRGLAKLELNEVIQLIQNKM